LSKEEITDPPTQGILIYGLYCDGFGYNLETNEIADQKPGVT